LYLHSVKFVPISVLQLCGGSAHVGRPPKRHGTLPLLSCPPSPGCLELSMKLSRTIYKK
jgi:hypothetical protein